jgi:hypothetical protein
MPPAESPPTVPLERLPPIRLLLDAHSGASGWLQLFAGGELWTASPVGAGARRAPRPQIAEAAVAPPATWSPIYDGPGLVDGGLHRLRSFLSSRGERRVDFADGESFRVDAEGGVVRRVGAGPAGARSLERALGAPLALALAVRGLHLLHASAIARRSATGSPDGAVAFTATSGAGKSTLAAAAGRPGDLRWLRIADDQLPVRLAPPVAALAHFPQLKLAPDEAYPASAPRALPLLHLCEIEHSPDFRSIELERLDPASACLALVRATVAAKLFDPALLQRHFEACAAAGRELPVHRLRFPSGLAHLPEVLAAIAREVEGSAPAPTFETTK